MGYYGSECAEQQDYQPEMTETRKINSRFGEIEYEPDKTIHLQSKNYKKDLKGNKTTAFIQ